MQFDQRLGDAEAQAGATDQVAQGVVGAEERSEDVWLRGLGDAHAGVAHVDAHLVAVATRDHVDVATLGGVLAGIADQVDGDLAQALAVGHDLRQALLNVDRQRDHALGELRVERFTHLGQELGQVERLAPQADLACLGFGNVQQFVEQLDQPHDVVLDHPEKIALWLVQRAERAEEQQIDIATDRGQRRAQFVRCGGDKLALQPIGQHLARDIVVDHDPAEPLAIRCQHRRAMGPQHAVAHLELLH